MGKLALVAVGPWSSAHSGPWDSRSGLDEPDYDPGGASLLQTGLFVHGEIVEVDVRPLSCIMILGEFNARDTDCRCQWKCSSLKTEEV